MITNVPQRFRSNCELCGVDLDISKPGVRQYMEGWVEKRADGGGHSIESPTRHMRFACRMCMESRRKKGAGQASLFG